MKVGQLAPKTGELQLIDVRHPHEWDAGHIKGSRHLPLDQLVARMREVDPGRPVVMVCRAGPRSVQAVTLLRARSRPAEYLEGGVLAWVEAGLPLEGSDGRPGIVVPADLPEADLPRAASPPPGVRGLAAPALRDVELATTMAATAEDLGYSTIWVADEPEGYAIPAARAMLAATSTIRVGIGPIAVAPGGAAELLDAFGTASLPVQRTALVLEGLDSPAWTPEARRSTFASLRANLGPEFVLGVCALAEDTCRFGGEVADLVCLDWMTPQRMAWARGHIDEGAERRAGGLPAPRVLGLVRVALGEGAALRLSEAALPYHLKPHYAASFDAMGAASAGIAAPAAPEAWAMAEAYTAVLDEAVVRPVAKLPTSASPDLGEVFYALSIVLEVAHAFAPGADH